MSIQDTLIDLQNKYNVIDIINCDDYLPDQPEFFQRVKNNYQESFQNDDRLIFTYTKEYKNVHSENVVLHSIQSIINEVDISNFFVTIVTTNNNLRDNYEWVLKNISTDEVPFHLITVDGEYSHTNSDVNTYYKYKRVDIPDGMTDEEKHLFFESKVFCILPWISLYPRPNGEVLPCCNSTEILDSLKNVKLEKIWNGEKMKDLRLNLLKDEPIESCKTCYLREQTYKDQTNYRMSYNRKFINEFENVRETNSDGSLNDFKLKYVLSKHDNLCNLTCRSCHSSASSSLYKVEKDLNIIDHNNGARLFAGNYETDLYEQLSEHVNSVEQILFEGGEPLMNKQTYDFIELLDQNNKHDTDMTFITNMTHTGLKDRNFLDVCKNFSNLIIYGSLDAEGDRGAYLRTGTDWKKVLKFRYELKEKRNDENFWIHNTVSIINVLHTPDFHKSWVEKGLVNPSNFLINVLYRPEFLKVANAPPELKEIIRQKYKEHIDWLRPLDPFGKSVSGYESVLDTIDNENVFDGELFWSQIDKFDNYYGQYLLDYFPELEILNKYRKTLNIINTHN